jgi:hypothetical protein
VCCHSLQCAVNALHRIVNSGCITACYNCVTFVLQFKLRSAEDLRWKWRNIEKADAERAQRQLLDLSGNISISSAPRKRRKKAGSLML